jgi:hypothetical protein
MNTSNPGLPQSFSVQIRLMLVSVNLLETVIGVAFSRATGDLKKVLPWTS